MLNNTLFFNIYLLILFIAATIERVRAIFPNIGRTEQLEDRMGTFVDSLAYYIIFLGSIADYLINKNAVNYQTAVFGCVCYFLGLNLRNVSIRTLGDAWSVHSDATYVNRIVRTGPYKHVNHPYYFSVFMELLGIAMLLGSCYGVMAILFLQLPIVLVRVYFEEKKLIAKFGREYKRR